MIKLKFYFVFCIIFGFINISTSNYSYSNKNYNNLTNNTHFDEQFSFVDLNNKEIMEEIYKKIKHYESIERDPIQHFNPNEIKQEIKQEKFRSLSDENVFEDITLVDLASYYFYHLGRWFNRGTTDSESRIIVYPYSFDYQYQNINNETISKHYPQGAFISLKSSELDPLIISLKTNGTFKAKRARAVIDGDIAILSIEAIISNYNQDLFQDSVDWCSYFRSNFLTGDCYPNYEDFYKHKKQDPIKKYITRLNETDIKNGGLSLDGVPNFGVLIIPDFKLGTDDIIKSKLGSEGIKKIQEFYKNGGSIIVTGKSGVLFEDFGIIEKGTYNRKKIFNVETADRQIGIKGCEDTYNKKYDEKVDDFVKQLICVKINRNNKKVGLSSTFKTIKEDKSFETLIEVDSEDEDLVTVDTETGLSYSLTEEEKKYNPLIMHKSNDKNGHLYILNFNPFFKNPDLNVVYNMIWLVFSKELYIISKVNMNNNSSLAEGALPIPAGETGVELEVETLFHNLNDKIIKNFKFFFFLQIILVGKLSLQYVLIKMIYHQYLITLKTKNY